jgi:hypothetical protein
VTRVNPSTDKPDDNDLTANGREVYELLVDYAKQETTEPLRGLGRYLGFGAGGAVFVSMGSTLLVVGVLRWLQTETGSTFTGNWSWVPYLLTVVVAVAIIGLAVLAITRASTPGEKAARQRAKSDRKDS